MGFSKINGIVLHYRVEGVGDGLPLVFINSLGSDLRIWDGMMSYFAAGYRVVRYDKRGHGLSDCPAGPYSIRDHANDLVGLLDELDIERAIVVGISVGGMIGLDFAATFPERVRALILSDTGAQIGTAVYWNQRIQNLQKQGLAHLADVILSRWFAPQFAKQQPVAYRGYSNMLTRTPLDGYIATCAAIRDADLRDAARTIRVSSLVLCGAQDLATTPELGRELAGLLGNGRFHPIPNAAHLPCIEQPEAMATQINQFLQENNHV